MTRKSMQCIAAVSVIGVAWLAPSRARYRGAGQRTAEG